MPIGWEFVAQVPSSSALSYGSSKLFQIVIPLATVAFFQELLFRRRLIPRAARWLSPGLSAAADARLGRYQTVANRTLGLMSWKIGCDLGFFLIATGIGPWERAFTWAGLIPYTIVQYLFYYLIGQRMILEGRRHPFQPDASGPNYPTRRPSQGKQLLAKFFHESMNQTDYNVPLRQVILKPLVDYGGIVLSWSIYSSGLLFLQSGEINFQPLFNFFFLKILAFYSVNVFGFILGYNLAESAYEQLIRAEERADGWARQQQATGDPHPLARRWNAFKARWRRFQCVRLNRVLPLLERYNLNWRWLLTSAGGIAFIVAIALDWAGLIFSTYDRAEHWAFAQQGELDRTHLSQVEQTSAARPRAASTSQELLEQFPQRWDALFLRDGSNVATR
ncbi:MAG: hypothetical protein BRC58_10605 [Cyanobacteria bacterium QS_8_64_29]|nr:MAG: hypothetical protein BRC58_10605 [Cyanobacteria bacterium QS_8_64_29]